MTVKHVMAETQHTDPRDRKQVPLQHHFIVTAPDGTETLVSYGEVAAVRVPPYGAVILPPSWESAQAAVQRQRMPFTGMSVRDIRESLRFSQRRCTVSPVPLPLPLEWLELHGPDSANPYTVGDYALPFVGTDGQCYAVSEAHAVQDDLTYSPGPE